MASLESVISEEMLAGQGLSGIYILRAKPAIDSRWTVCYGELQLDGKPPGQDRGASCRRRRILCLLAVLCGCLDYWRGSQLDHARYCEIETQASSAPLLKRLFLCGLVDMVKTQLCATVTGKSMRELRSARDAQIGADLVELRLDSVRGVDVKGALADRRQPTIVTCRPKWEGGAFDGSEEERRELLLQACAYGAEFVDIEHRASFARELLDRRAGRGVILSFHTFDGVPRDLDDRYRAMRATGAEVVKIAATVKNLQEGLRVMSVGKIDEPRVLIGMGASGVVTRVLASRFGTCWSYAGSGVAPGQIDLQRMQQQFAFHDITERTAVYGVLGSPVSHSVSPAMHNAGFRATGIDAVYVPFETCDLDDFSGFAQAIGVRGVSVTAPFKETVAKRVVETDATSRAVGAVNTIRVGTAGWFGCNTDVAGFLAPLTNRIRLPGTRATVLGAGGAARSAAWGLVREGAAVTVCARRQEKASDVARVVGATAADMPPERGSWDLLVNTTPVGTFPNLDDSPLPNGPFDGGLVYDLVYNPSTTRLMRDAVQGGCDTIGGLEMLVDQALRQFEWWTGQTAPESLFFEAAKAELERQMDALTA